MFHCRGSRSTFPLFDDVLDPEQSASLHIAVRLKIKNALDPVFFPDGNLHHVAAPPTGATSQSRYGTIKGIMMGLLDGNSLTLPMMSTNFQYFHHRSTEDISLANSGSADHNTAESELVIPQEFVFSSQYADDPLISFMLPLPSPQITPAYASTIYQLWDETSELVREAL